MNELRTENVGAIRAKHVINEEILRKRKEYNK